ncbi:galactose oxidase [Brevibacillus laterosporus]|uniref:Kelch repeat-containing protein n=1 Tax=Brevibacillus laterosporus TaxID=1465 RepID=UPI000BCD0103|nr:kelch repeat-containing protein [Brevibacillus laterosporus]PCN43599.1 galactose oxidase [Brevibacillus laterosporus]
MNLKKIGLFALAMIMTLFSFQTYSFAAEEMDWIKKAPMPTGRHSMGSTVYKDKIYVYAGGHESQATDVLEVYDPAKDQWEVKTGFTPKIHTTLVAFQDKLYSFGGMTFDFKYLDSTEEYDPVLNQWSRKTSMPTARSRVAAVATDDYIYTIGGGNTEGVSPVVEVYNPITDSWVTKNPFPLTSSRIRAFLVNDTVYALANKNNVEHLYSYDQVNDIWTLIDQFPGKKQTSFAIAVSGDKIFIPDLYEVDYYDLTERKLIKYKSTAPYVSDYVSQIINNKLYVIGGSYEGFDTVNELDISDVVQLSPDPNPEPKPKPEPEPEPEPKPEPNPEPKPNPNPNPTGNALLVIYMDSGLIKEYEMTNEEIRNFTEWYEDRAKGNGKEAYIVNKKYNIGPFNSRKDFISYSHIESFEVQEFSR